MTVNKDKNVFPWVRFILLFCLFETGTGNGGFVKTVTQVTFIIEIYLPLFVLLLYFRDSCLTFLFLPVNGHSILHPCSF